MLRFGSLRVHQRIFGSFILPARRNLLRGEGEELEVRLVMMTLQTRRNHEAGVQKRRIYRIPQRKL